MAHPPLCVVVGVGPGNGASFARLFAGDGYAIALLARDETFSKQLAATLPSARAWSCDVTNAAAIESTFAEIRATLGDPEVVVYNAGSGAFGTFETVSAADFESAWRVNALGLFVVAKQVVPAMKAAGRGSIVIVGATALRRGMPMTVTFAPAKAAQRSLAESLARHLWPAGIHVSLIIVDGAVDLPRTRQRMADKSDEFFIKPDDIAATASWLVQQPRSAWAFEVEARPFAERW